MGTDTWFRASSRGNGVGLTVIAEGSTASVLIIHVLPKLWGPSSPRHFALEAGAVQESTNHVDVNEGDTLGLPSPWSEHLEAVVVGPSGGGDAEASADASNEQEPGALDPLWELAPPPGAHLVERARAVPRPHREHLVSLLLDYSMTPVPVSGERRDFSAGEATFAADSSLRSLLLALFIDRVKETLPYRRPAYRDITENLGVIRGRMVPAALMRRQATRNTRIVCEFDELSNDTGPWQAIRTALESCSEVRGRQESLLGSLAQLRDVGVATPSEVVAREIQDRRATRDPRVRELHALAITVLRAEHHASAVGQLHNGVMVNLKFESSRLWELMLARAFTSDLYNVDEHTQLRLFYRQVQSGSWRSTTAKKPDLLVKRAATSNAVGASAQQLFVDAKYIRGRSLATASKSDQYQIAAYAMRSAIPSFLVFAEPFDGTVDTPARPSDWSHFRIPRSDLPWDEVTASDSSLQDGTSVGSFRLPFPRPGRPEDTRALSQRAQAALEFIHTQFTSCSIPSTTSHE